MSVVLKTIPEPTTLAAPAQPLPLYRFTVEQYRSMIEAGVLSENDRVELLEGWFVSKMTHNPPHDATISLAKQELEAILPEGWMLRIQSAITTADSEPEPDVALVRAPARRYVRSHPRSKDIGLLIEVAERTFSEDRNYKGRVYARARIVAYWIINLPESKVEVYTHPKAGKFPAYRQRRDCGINDVVPVMLEGREIVRIPVRDLLP